MRAAEVEVLFTANTDGIAKADKQIKDTGQRVEKNPIKLDANGKPALEQMDRVETAAKKLVSKDTLMTVDVNIERGEKSLDRVQKRLDYLRSVETTMDVKADVARAEASLSKVKRNLDGLKAARATMEVDADTSGAESALKDVQDVAGESGEDAGAEFGDSIIAALATIPIAGAVVGILAAAGKAGVAAFQKGLQIEVGYDRLQALTGLDPAAAQRLGNAAGEAYANNFGDSIESNMDATRLALQFRIIDPAATTRDAQLVVQGLAGIADVLGEDVQPVAKAVASLLSSGVAKSATEAFDLIATGARNGVDRGEDLLDTLTEYPALFQRLGLTGPEALGLISQGLNAGARNSDLAADALKEFQIRATDASEQSAEGFRALGLDAEEMTAKIAAGGEGAREGLDQVLDGLRAIEDPVQRNAAAVALFGTQAEDLGAALFAMDLSNAVDQLGQVTGAAQTMFDTLADNDASKIEQAQRNIEVAAQGIQGALAQAFSEPLGDFADWVSQNRGPVLQFFSELVNGAIDFGIGATESFGSFVSGPLADAIDGVAQLLSLWPIGQNTDDLRNLADDMRGFESNTDDAVAKLEEMRGQFNGFADAQVALGFVNDAALRTADAVSNVNVAVDGLNTANLQGTEAGRALDEQLQAVASSLDAEYQSALLAGESQENLRGRYDSTSQALMGQLTAMGLTQEQAQSLIDTVLKTPDEAVTVYSSNASAEAAIVDNLGQKIVQLPDGNFIVVADTSPAQRAVDDFIARNATKQVNIATSWSGGLARASGGPIYGPGGPRDDLVPVMASNGEHMLTAAEVMAMGGHAGVYQVRSLAASGDLRRLLHLADGGPVRVPPSTWRTQVPEARIRERVTGEGTVAPVAVSGPTVQAVFKDANFYSYDPNDVARAARDKLAQLLAAMPRT